MELSFLSILAFGMLLGLRHSLDADHLVAVSTIATRTKSPLKAGMTGAFWGVGHSVMILLVGTVVLMFDTPISDQLSFVFETIVGILLIFLGYRAIRLARNVKEMLLESTPLSTYHKRSFLIGLVHGLAGSAALLLLVINQVKDVSSGILFLLLFGAGSIAGMFVCAALYSIPMRMAKTEMLQKGLFLFVGLLSAGYGLHIIFFS